MRFTFKVLDHLVEAVLAILMAGTVVIVAVAVVFRYVLNDSLPWPEEISSNLLVWITMIGSYLCFRLRTHLAVDILPDMLPHAAQRFLAGVRALILIATLGLLAWYSVKVIQVIGGNPLRTVSLPRGLFLAVIPISAVLMILAILRDFFDRRS